MIDWYAFLFPLLGSFIFMSLMFAIAVLRQRFDIIDVAWGLTFISIALVSFTTVILEPQLTVQVIITTLVIIWGSRLSAHIYSRWSKSDKEDKRYAVFRQQYKKSFGGVAFNVYTRIFLLQAALAVIVSFPVIIVNTSSVPLTPTLFTLLGVIVWAVGFYFETVGDYQLKKFTSSSTNKGKLMTAGLWKYTRHPNYFGEMTQWWAIFIIAFAAVPSLGWLSLVGPAVITILILFVSGIPIAERHIERRQGWSEYKKHTSKLIPLPKGGKYGIF